MSAQSATSFQIKFTSVVADGGPVAWLEQLYSVTLPHILYVEPYVHRPIVKNQIKNKLYLNRTHLIKNILFIVQLQSSHT